MSKKSLNLEKVSLESVCHLITDGKHGDCKNEEGSGYYFLSAKDVRNGELQYEDARQITKDDFIQTHKRTQLEPLDILISNSGTIGRMAIAKDSELTRRTTFQKSVAILKPIKQRVYPRWLFYYLQSVKDDLINTAGGTAQVNLLLRDLRAFKIKIPPFSTQRKIAAILSAYDDLIENNMRRIKILEEMVQALYREWFVNFRFPGHEQMQMVHSSLGLIPEGWEVKRLGSVATINTNTLKGSVAPAKINYIDIASVSTGQIDKIEAIAFENAPSRARRIVRHGDIIWSTVRPNRRSYALILDPIPNLIVSTGFAVISAIEVPFTYLYYALTSDSFVDYLTNHATGAAYPAVNSDDFRQADILSPSSFLLERFHDFAAPILDQKQNLQTKNTNLRRTRDLLLPRLISGELDVADLDIVTPEGTA